MSVVSVKNVVFEQNPAPFLSPIRMRVVFECYRDLPDEIEWRVVYIGSPKDERCDQVLDQFAMGPLGAGVMEFTIETNPPDHSKIPTREDLFGVTAIVLSVSYRRQEFFRVGFYLNNAYLEEELLQNEPEVVQLERLYRNILVDKPRLFPFQINWDEPKLELPLAQPTGADPFQRSNGVFDMFGPASQVPQFA